MATDNFFNKRFDGVQLLRALAAFSVVINHISFIENGAFGVDIFFCISGFIMMYVTEKGADSFIKKRIIRIVPLYYLMTIFTYVCSIIIPSLFEKTKLEPVHLIKSLLFIPFDIGGNIQPVVRVGWTLNYEVFFYVILWISLHISHKYRGFIASGVIMILVAMGLILNGTGYLAANGQELYEGGGHGLLFGLDEAVDFWTNSIMIEFIFGMAAYEILRRISEKVHQSTAITCILIAVSVVCYCLMWSARYDSWANDIPRFIVDGIPALIIFLAVFLMTYGKKLPAFPVFLGDISYSVYLIHYFIVRLFNHYVCPDGVADVKAVAGAVVLIVIVTLLSALSYRIIEMRSARFLKKIL